LVVARDDAAQSLLTNPIINYAVVRRKSGKEKLVVVVVAGFTRLRKFDNYIVCRRANAP
jgi:hypothetical protein